MSERQAEIDALEPWPLNDSVTAISSLISGSYPKRLDDEAHLFRRCIKVAEETGEMTEALLGMLGENPRKGRTHTPDDVRRELFDVALAALGAASHLDGDHADTAAMFRHHAHKVRLRLAAALDASRPHVVCPHDPPCRRLDSGWPECGAPVTSTGLTPPAEPTPADEMGAEGGGRR